MSYSLFCMGNPLLDMQVRDGEKLLEKYGLKANDAILAEEKHAELCVEISLFHSNATFPFIGSTVISDLSYDELVRDYQVTYVAGGAAQNAARGAAVSPSMHYEAAGIKDPPFSTCSHQNPSCTQVLSATINLPNNSRLPTPARALMKSISSKREKRQAPVVSSLRATTGLLPFALFRR